MRNSCILFLFLHTWLDKNFFRFSLKDISQLYQVFPDEILGSGQFGIVYGGMCFN